MTECPVNEPGNAHGDSIALDVIQVTISCLDVDHRLSGVDYIMPDDANKRRIARRARGHGDGICSTKEALAR